MKDSRLVYSTETGRICPECGRPVDACLCRKKEAGKADMPPAGYPDDGIVRIRREVKGHKGKTVWNIFLSPCGIYRFQPKAVFGKSDPVRPIQPFANLV